MENIFGATEAWQGSGGSRNKVVRFADIWRTSRRHLT
jgi:hypothetical protein